MMHRREERQSEKRQFNRKLNKRTSFKDGQVRSVSLGVVLVLTRVVALEQVPTDCQNEFAVAQTKYEQAIEDARNAAFNARQAKNVGDRDRCRWERGRAMAAANQVPKHWQIMNDLNNSVNCRHAVPSPPKFHDWAYGDMGFGYGEAGFILFSPLHCGLLETLSQAR